MMIGEFEYTSVFEGVFGLGPGDDPHEVKMYYSGITYTIFLIFLILMSIIIMNLLVGLAVDDIKAVQESAILKRLAMQVGHTFNIMNNLIIIILSNNDNDKSF